MYLRKIACPQNGLRPRYRVLAKSNRQASCKRAVLAILINMPQGADVNARGFCDLERQAIHD